MTGRETEIDTSARQKPYGLVFSVCVLRGAEVARRS